MVNFDYSELFSIYKGLLTQKQADVFSLYSECDLSLGEISEIKNVSRQSVSDCINKTKDLLLFYESKLELQKKKRELYKIKSKITNEEVANEISKLLGE